MDAVFRSDPKLASAIAEAMIGEHLSFGEAARWVADQPREAEAPVQDETPEDGVSDAQLRRWACATLRATTRRALPGLAQLEMQDVLDWLAQYVPVNEWEARARRMFA